MDAEDILLRGTGVGGSLNLSASFFPDMLNSPDLGCSSIEATSFRAPEEHRPAKRLRTEEEADDAQLQALQAEVSRLRGVNQLLHKSCVCIQEKATAALADNQKLLTLVSAMQPHKQSMHLHALDSQRSSVGSCTPGHDHKGEEEDPIDRFLAFDHSPSKSQPGPSEPAMTPCKDVKRRVQSARPLACPGSLLEVPRCEGAPGRLEDDPATAHAAAVAAAALAMNHGNPAAALLDLLHLAMRRKHDASPDLGREQGSDEEHY